MKKFVCIFLLVFLFQSGCSQSESPDPTVGPLVPDLPVEMQNNDEIRIIVPIDPERAVIPSDEFIENWEKYMLDKYGFRFDVDYVKKVMWYRENEEGDENGINIAELKELAGGGGFVYINNSSDLMALVNADLLMPVNGVIEEIDEYATYDPVIFQTCATEDGSKWLLPNFNTPPAYTVGRRFRRDWLSESGMMVPKTPDEFLDYAEYVSLEDPDGDGERNSYLTWYSISTLPGDFRDIFRAFGCYTSSASSPIAWNPAKREYELMAMNDKFVELMEYIMYLKEERYIYKAGYASRDNYDETSFKIASSYGTEAFGFDESEIGYYLTKYNEDFMFQANFASGFAVLKDTKDITGKMNAFINLVKVNEDVYPELRFGIKDTAYSEMEDYYMVWLKGDEKRRFEWIGIPTAFNRTVKPWKSATSKMNIKEWLRSSEDYRKMWEAGLSEVPSTMFYSIPLEAKSNRINQLNAMLRIEVYNLYEAIFTNNEPIQAAVSEFMNKAIGMGIPEELEKINQNIDD